MKVLHLGKFYPPAKGGMETILQLICQGTAADVDNTVLVANHARGGRTERVGTIQIRRLRVVKQFGAVAICPTLPWRLAAEQADIIVHHEPNPMGLLAYFLARPSGKLVVWYHSDVIRPSWRYNLFYRPLLQFALRRAERIAVSSSALAASAPALRDWQAKCVIIPFGIEPRQASLDVSRRAEAIRAAHPRPLVLFVGRLVPYKGVDVLLDAMQGVDAIALIVGDGPQRESLQKKASELGVSERVKFLGEVSDTELAALYTACDIFVLPSITRQEAFGVVLLEAMAFGKPMVTTRLGTGADWVNQDGETGIVVPPGDASALSTALGSLVRDRSRRGLMGSAGLRRVQTLFAPGRMATSVLALYRQLMGQDDRQAVA